MFLRFGKQKSERDGKQGGMEDTQRLVDAAYALHESLYAQTEEARAASMQRASEEAVAAVDACEAAVEAEGGPAKDAPMQARLWYLRGKSLACTPAGRSSDATIRLLSDAVKLDPALTDAWDCLGECFWSQGDLEAARFTFLGALEHARTATTLCHLSMLLRGMSRQGPGVNEAQLSESVQLAKEAVRLNATSARAWCGLGNAHLALYGSLTSSVDDLQMAHRAFVQACGPVWSRN